MLKFYEKRSDQILLGKICDHARISLITIGLTRIDPDGWCKMGSVKPGALHGAHFPPSIRGAISIVFGPFFVWGGGQCSQYFIQFECVPKIKILASINSVLCKNSHPFGN